MRVFFKLTSKRYFWHICDNCSKDSSQTKSQNNRRKIIESLNLPLRNNIKIFITCVHRTSYGHFKGWSKKDKFDLSGIGTQN
jgi:hypothetical protein